MGATKTWSILLREKEYTELPFEFINRCIETKCFYDDYNKYKDNKEFQKLYKAKKKANKELDNWKFKQRHS